MTIKQSIQIESFDLKTSQYIEKVLFSLVKELESTKLNINAQVSVREIIS